MTWQLEVGLLEAKRTFSYRVDFWLQFVVSSAVEILVAYYLWQYLYLSQGVSQFGGYDFHTMLVYYIFTPFVGRIVRARDDFNIAREIYDGGLNKYLIYPVSFLNFKFIERLSVSLLTMFQTLLAILVLSLFMDLSSFLTPHGLFFGFLFSLNSFVLFFALSFCLEICALWIETVWSLGVMLRFITMFLGGAMIPLSLFPEAVHRFLLWTPFPYLFSLPIRLFLNQIPIGEATQGFFITILWSFVFIYLGKFILKIGLKNYSGIGI